MSTNLVMVAGHRDEAYDWCRHRGVPTNRVIIVGSAQQIRGLSSPVVVVTTCGSLRSDYIEIEEHLKYANAVFIYERS